MEAISYLSIDGKLIHSNGNFLYRMNEKKILSLQELDNHSFVSTLKIVLLVNLTPTGSSNLNGTG